MAESLRICIADDDVTALFALKTLLEAQGWSVRACERGDNAWSTIQEHTFDLIVLDLQMPGESGIELCRKIKEDPTLRYIPVALLTANADLESVTAGLTAGADTYITKPYRKEELLARLHALLRTKQLYQELKSAVRENKTLRALVADRAHPKNIVGSSTKLKEIFALIDKIKDSPLPVFIHGESGTGKELIARAMHEASCRRNGPLVIQNCAALSERLLESELFGHVRGAFTGAVRDKEGLFELADGGTLFLDEVGEMSLPLQAKLLRVVQEGTFTKVGGTTQQKVTVRIVTATHKNLQEMVSRGSFREDLFYRLNVLTIEVPPLRDRKDDIAPLAEFFLQRACTRDARPQKKLSSECLKLLQHYKWPGNIRELQNEIERLALLSGDAVEIEPSFLSSPFRGETSREISSITPTSSSAPLKDQLEELERVIITDALRRHQGNKSKVAEELQISRTSLIKKVQEYES